MSLLEGDLLILGASMLGVELVYQLRKRGKGTLRTIVVDRQTEHPYIPLCHERLCGRIPTKSTVLDTAAYVAGDPQARFVKGEIEAFDPNSHVAKLADGTEVRGRFVVVALGSRVSPPDGLAGHERLLRLKSEADWARANEALEELLEGGGEGASKIVVVGGGISGVELAGELAHLRKQRPPGWGWPKVTLVHAGQRLLPGLSEGAGRRAARLLEGQGVELRLGAKVEEVGQAAVQIRTGPKEAQLGSELSFWAGGLRPPPILDAFGLPRTAFGWLSVGPTLQCFPTAAPSNPDVFAAGDVARIHGGDGEWPTMQRAIECLWQAKTLAKNVLTLAAEEPNYPRGVPPLRPHALRTDFFHGVSLGKESLIVYGKLGPNLRSVSVWFRRWLMEQYLARYRA
jgi:NADH dehydrogenase